MKRSGVAQKRPWGLNCMRHMRDLPFGKSPKFLTFKGSGGGQLKKVLSADNLYVSLGKGSCSTTTGSCVLQAFYRLIRS